MFLWFVAGSVAIVWLVFQSPGIDVRLVAFASVLPLAEIIFGGPRVLHTLLGAVVVLGVVMVVTSGRRLVRRRALGVAIGLFLHLVLDGTWTDSRLFWWPLRGTDFPDAGLAELHRGGVGLVMELVGAIVLVWLWRVFEIGDGAKRARLWREGRIDHPAIGGR